MCGHILQTLLLSVLCLTAVQVARANGTAADLDGLEPVGWPLGVPMTCVQISAAVDSSLKESVLKLRDYCNKQNVKMKSEGYASCALDMCLDASTTTSQGKDYGSVRLRLGRSEWTDAYFATLNYTFPAIRLETQQPTLSCFDPAERAEGLLRAELETWDFQRFVEFCIKGK